MELEQRLFRQKRWFAACVIGGFIEDTKHCQIAISAILSEFARRDAAAGVGTNYQCPYCGSKVKAKIVKADPVSFEDELKTLADENIDDFERLG